MSSLPIRREFEALVGTIPDANAMLPSDFSNSVEGNNNKRYSTKSVIFTRFQANRKIP
jgi:hypothetical protein